MATINDNNTKSSNNNGNDKEYNHQKKKIDTYYNLHYSNANHSDQEKLHIKNDIAHYLFSNGLDADKYIEYGMYMTGALYAPLPPLHSDGCIQGKSEQTGIDNLIKAASKSKEIAYYIYALQDKFNDPEYLEDAWKQWRLFQIKNDLRLDECAMMIGPLLQTESDMINDMDRMLTYKVNYKKHADLSRHEMLVKIGKSCFLEHKYKCIICELGGNKYNACRNKDTCKYNYERTIDEWENQMNIYRKFRVNRRGKMEGAYYIGTVIKMTIRVYRMIKMIAANKGINCCCDNMDECTDPYAH